MPVVLRIGPYVFFFYSEEGKEAPHVHVRRDENLAKFWLDPFQRSYSYGFPAREQRLIGRMVQEHREFLLEKWNEYFRRKVR